MKPPKGAVRVPGAGAEPGGASAAVSGRAARAAEAARAKAEKSRKLVEGSKAVGKELEALDKLNKKQTGASPFDMLDTLPATLKKAKEPAAELSKTLGDGGDKLLTSVVAASKHLEAMHTKLAASQLLSLAVSPASGDFVKSFTKLDPKGKAAAAEAAGISVEDLEKLIKTISSQKKAEGDTTYLTADALKNTTFVLRIGKNQFKAAVESVVNGDL
tara:strand:- start:34 stop:681 length:648 start_codon:yes stop_codon:yes gene_type:complete